MTEREPIEPHVRGDEVLDALADLVVRGWPLTVEGLQRNAEATGSRFSRNGDPFVAVSAEVTVESWTLESILAGPRLRTRSRYAAVAAGRLLNDDYELVATFGSPHYSIVLEPYTSQRVEGLLRLLGEPRMNPYYVRRPQ